MQKMIIAIVFLSFSFVFQNADAALPEIAHHRGRGELLISGSLRGLCIRLHKDEWDVAGAIVRGDPQKLAEALPSVRSTRRFESHYSVAAKWLHKRVYFLEMAAQKPYDKATFEQMGMLLKNNMPRFYRNYKKYRRTRTYA